jgi:hypothetical protein
VSDYSDEGNEPEAGGYAGAGYGEGYGGHPGIATSICALLLVASCAGSHGGAMVSAGGDEGRAELIGMIMGGAIVGMILWAIAYAITIKRASPGWKVGSAIFLVILGLVVSLVRVGIAGSATREDAGEALTQMQSVVSSNGKNGPIKPSADAGPMTSLSTTFINDEIAQSKQYDAEATAAGLEMVLSFKGLTKSSPVLDHCDRVASLAARAESNKARFPERIANLRKQGDAYVARGDFDQRNLDALLAGMSDNRAVYDRQWALTGQLSTDAASLCRVLARRHWQMSESGQVLFTSHADLSEAQPILTRINATAAEWRKGQDDARVRAQGDIDQMRKVNR